MNESQIPADILKQLKADRGWLLHNGSVRRRALAEGYSYRVRYRTRSRKDGIRMKEIALPGCDVAVAVANLLEKWRDVRRKKLETRQKNSDGWKRLVAEGREELESFLDELHVTPGRRRATRRSFKEACAAGFAAYMGFLNSLRVTPPGKPGRPRKRRLGLYLTDRT